MNILDLMAGAGDKDRRDKIESMGHTYTTVDIDPSFGCTITADIFDLGDELGVFDFVWASPPCEKFSVSSIGKYWNKDNTPKLPEVNDAVKLVKQTIKICQEHSRLAWAIENPVGKLRKLDFMQEIPRSTVTYCRYGINRMKPTDIWHIGLNWKPREMCKRGNPDHISSPRGSRTGTQGMDYAEKSIVPWELWKEILECIDEETY